MEWYSAQISLAEACVRQHYHNTRCGPADHLSTPTLDSAEGLSNTKIPPAILISKPPDSRPERFSPDDTKRKAIYAPNPLPHSRKSMMEHGFEWTVYIINAFILRTGILLYELFSLTQTIKTHFSCLVRKKH